MDLELGQLELRYEKLRKRSARRERQLLGSLSEHGQLLPVVVVRAEAAERFVLLDGYKRVRALRRLASDTVRATLWDLPVADALLLERLMRSAEEDSPIEQGWLLSALRAEFGLSLEELSRRFDRTKSWVSRRLALVEKLPEVVQERVRTGILAPHAAMKFFVPLARANHADCVRLATALTESISIRQAGALYAAYKAGNVGTRSRLCTEPHLALRALDAGRDSGVDPLPAGEHLLRDAGVLGGVARRLTQRLREGHARQLATRERAELARALGQARLDTTRLFTLSQQELHDAQPQHAQRDPAPA